MCGLKRKIRNYVEMVKEKDPNYGIYIKENVPLNTSDKTALAENGYPKITDTDLKKLKKSDPDIDGKLLDYMCSHYYDIRTFGAVMTTFVKAPLIAVRCAARCSWASHEALIPSCRRR